MKGIGTPVVAVLRHQDMGARRPPRHLVPVETCGGEGNVLGLLGMTGKNLGPENDAENVWLPSDLVEERIELHSRLAKLHGAEAQVADLWIRFTEDASDY
jgi:hypothetical protein